MENGKTGAKSENNKDWAPEQSAFRQVHASQNAKRATQNSAELPTLKRAVRANWPAVKAQLEQLGACLPKQKLIQAITVLSEARKRRFLRSRRPKYGSMNKGFTEEELERFFRFVDDERFRLIFSFQAFLGLRIGEAIRINVKDINLRTRELRTFTEKSGKTDYLLIPDHLFEATLEFISA
ncbi:tyrosine-type recombinase/integrase, partial [Candidatus Micrarchaeota archaeon]|nr:tyrosine-type recombinase/integrase [Candidatus Micrarchaeota archaeon]MBD3418372.1 tyrosine-type recombinase/integrase [Candidatus Micrarchaeota archaeon]